MTRDDSGMLDMRQMPTLIHDDEARIRQALAPQCGVCRGHDLVVIAPENERRQFNAVQLLLKVRIKPAWLPTKLRDSKAVLEHHVHLRLAGALAPGSGPQRSDHGTDCGPPLPDPI